MIIKTIPIIANKCGDTRLRSCNSRIGRINRSCAPNFLIGVRATRVIASEIYLFWKR